MSIYFPALKLKQGEYSAISMLPDEICNLFEPRLIVPPPKSRDPEKGRRLTTEEISYDVGKRIGQHWLTRQAFLDVQFVDRELSREELVRLVLNAKSYNSRLVQLVALNGPARDFYDATELSKEHIRAIIVNALDFEINLEKIHERLFELDIDPQNTVCFIDFTGDLSNLETATQSISGTLLRAVELFKWKRVIFQGSNFPDKLPNDELTVLDTPRNEWIAYQKSLNEIDIAPSRFGFGDFCADRDEQTFPNGGKAVRHLRYTTTKSHKIVRGQATGSQAEAMRRVCNLIENSEFYDGRDFCYADEAIFQISNNMRGAAGATFWRELNTARHISRTVFDLSQSTENPISTKKLKHEIQEELF